MGTTGIWGGGGLGGGECGAVTGVEFHDGYCCANGEVECCSCGRGCCCVYGAAVIGRGSCGFRGGVAVLFPWRVGGGVSAGGGGGVGGFVTGGGCVFMDGYDSGRGQWGRGGLDAVGVAVHGE